MSARQLIVLALAALAAIGALFLIRAMGSREEPQVAAPIEGEQILVASRDIPQGAALAPSDFRVVTMPESSVAPIFISITKQPSAQADYVGAVTRRPISQGEPITTTAVIQPDGRGFMAAILEPGYRAVATEIDSTTAAGGFIQPNDRVDVIATYAVRGSGGSEEQRSETIIRDVRVLAIGDATQPQVAGDAPMRLDANVAVLELDTEAARILAMAQEMGEIDLALRGVQAETVGLNRGDASMGGPSGSVRVHGFGSVEGANQ
jgi:pilus assembly protein CpaB